MELDETDRKILSLLKDDARLSFSEIGDRVHLSAPAVHARVKRMEKSGVITHYTIGISPESIGKPLCAFVRLTHGKCQHGEINKKLAAIKEVEECHSVAGEDCMVLKLRVSSPFELSRVLDKVRQIDGINRTVTSVVLETHFDRGTEP